MDGFLNKLANNEQAGSLANRFRKKRFELFLRVTSSIRQPLRIIDVGGTENYWEKMGFVSTEQALITLVNLQAKETKYENLKNFAGDARNLQQFEDNSFDVAFSNSVIEHVGSFNDQMMMVNEMRRLSPRLYLQTPNRYFPLEPHFLFPFFQFLPICIRVWLLLNFQLGWYPRYSNRVEATQVATSIRLMTLSELRRLFPKATIIKEKVLFFTKSYVVLEGF